LTTTSPATPPDPPALVDPRAALREALLAFGVATVLCAALYWTGQVVPIVQRNLGGLVALVFLVLPIRLLDRREVPLAQHGITWRPLARPLVIGILATAVFLGLFVALYVTYYRAVCEGAELLGPLGRRCERFVGTWDAWHLRVPPRFWEQVLGQVVVVAIPEEVFYRGYLLGRLEEALPSRRRLLGVPVGWPILLQAGLFGLGHFLVDWNPLRLAVALPALLFAALRAWGGNLVAPVIFHASANLLVLVVDRSFFV
jgi:uncharacterized protein